jgi:hypothetical protein
MRSLVEYCAAALRRIKLLGTARPIDEVGEVDGR